MAGLSATWKGYIVNALLRGDASKFPPTVTARLYIGDPLVAGTEVTGTDYAAQSITFHAPDGNGAATNHETVEFPVAGSNWGTVTHLGLFAAGSPGSVIGSISIGSFAMPTGSQMVFADGSITFYWS